MFGFEAARNFFEYKEDEVGRNVQIDETGTDEVAEENEEEIGLLLICCCDDDDDDDDAIILFPRPTHLFPGVLANCSRSRKNQDAVILFNNNCNLLSTQRNNGSYFHGTIEDNNRALISMMSMIQDQILQSIRSEVGYAAIKMQSSICNCEDAVI